MKFRNFFAVAAIAGLAACSSPYRATDTTTTTTDGTTTTTTTGTVTVPATLETSFRTQYPNASNIVWSNYDAAVEVPIDWELTGWSTLDNQDYLVRFDLDNENYYAWYDSDGNWIGSAYIMKDHSGLPAPVSAVVNEKYAGYTIKSVNREFQKDRMAYEIEMEKDNSKVKMLVDADGNVIKEKMKTK
jgi:hypothetical protein